MSLTVAMTSAGYRAHPVLSDIRFDLSDGTLTAVIGRNGSGKSTLVRAIASLIPYVGSVRADGVELSSLSHRERAQILSALLQEPAHPRMSVEELVFCGRNPHRSLLGTVSDLDRACVERAIRMADLTSLRARNADTLSGGELRRAYFGALLAQNAQNVLLDEATAFMDADYGHRFLSLARSLAHDDGRAVLSVMHDLSSALFYADRILLLDAGTQLFFGSPAELLETDLIERTFRVRRFCSDGRVFFA